MNTNTTRLALLLAEQERRAERELDETCGVARSARARARLGGDAEHEALRRAEGATRDALATLTFTRGLALRAVRALS